VKNKERKKEKEGEREKRVRETKEQRIVNRNITRQMEQKRIGKHTDVEK
jgi:hypothetical protein